MHCYTGWVQNKGFNKYFTNIYFQIVFDKLVKNAKDSRPTKLGVLLHVISCITDPTTLTLRGIKIHLESFRHLHMIYMNNNHYSIEKYSLMILVEVN